MEMLGVLCLRSTTADDESGPLPDLSGELSVISRESMAPSISFLKAGRLELERAT